jgi:hypothetical protein
MRYYTTACNCLQPEGCSHWCTTVSNCYGSGPSHGSPQCRSDPWQSMRSLRLELLKNMARKWCMSSLRWCPDICLQHNVQRATIALTQNCAEAPDSGLGWPLMVGLTSAPVPTTDLLVQNAPAGKHNAQSQGNHGGARLQLNFVFAAGCWQCS